MNTLIVYYSFTGNNETVAKAWKTRLGCDLLKIEPRRKRNGLSIILDLLFKRMPALCEPELSVLRYDHIVLMAPVWAGKIASPLHSFLHAQKGNIRNYSFITACGGGQQTQKNKIRQELTSLLSCTPTTVSELWMTKLIPPDKTQTLAASKIQIKEKDLEMFKGELDAFVKNVEDVSRTIKSMPLQAH